MRNRLPRFTIRRLMIAVAVVAVVLRVGGEVYRFVANHSRWLISLSVSVLIASPLVLVVGVILMNLHEAWRRPRDRP